MNRDTVTLESKLNRALARIMDLEEQARVKDQQWSVIKREHALVETIAKELSSEILVRDSSEIVLGENYSWDSFTSLELLEKALRSYKKQNADKTDMLRKLLDISESRRLEMESLKEQIEVIKEMKRDADHDLDDPVEPEKQVEESEMNEKPLRVEAVIEEDQDVQEADIQEITEVIEIEQAAAATATIPVHPSRKKQQAIDQKRKEIKQSHVVDLSEYESKMTDFMWDTLSVIGGEGISEYQDIGQRLREITKDDIAKTKIRMSIMSLYSMQILSQDQISDPLRSRFTAYRLTEIGHRLYKKHFKQTPVLSELDVMVSQHDNVNHGYGIRTITRILNEKKIFDEVSCDTKANKIELHKGGVYIPDVVAKKGESTYYFEYECGNHTQQDFSAKCNKMCKVTSDLFFVVPNREVLEKRLMIQVEGWIKQRGGKKALSGKTVRISTVKALNRTGNCLNSKNWQVVYNMASDQPDVSLY